jgi:hypothetical protein
MIADWGIYLSTLWYFKSRNIASLRIKVRPLALSQNELSRVQELQRGYLSYCKVVLLFLYYTEYTIGALSGFRVRASEWSCAPLFTTGPITIEILRLSPAVRLQEHDSRTAERLFHCLMPFRKFITPWEFYLYGCRARELVVRRCKFI